MAKPSYQKPSLSYPQQLQQLKNRGLTVEDDSKALHLLANLSYYRLSGYWYPLLANKQTHRFKPNATFDTAFDLYCFDRELRLLVLNDLEKIEVSFRAQMAYTLSQRYSPSWFRDSQLFKNATNHTKSLSKIRQEYACSDDQFVKSFKKKYADPIAPAWITLEICSFGTLSRLYENLKSGRDKRDIAAYFYLPDTVLETWLHSMVYVRNVCAHHARLWNREMRIQPKHPQKPRKQWLTDQNVSNKRIYFILSAIVYLLNTVNPHHSFQKKFTALLKKYPNVDTGAMGFSTNWQNEPLWN